MEQLDLNFYLEEKRKEKNVANDTLQPLLTLQEGQQLLNLFHSAMWLVVICMNDIIGYELHDCMI